MATAPFDLSAAPEDQPQTLLVMAAGADSPGVTATLMAALAATAVEVLDLEQVVIRGQLTLGILLGPAPAEYGAALALDRAGAVVTQAGADLDLQVRLLPGVPERSHHRRSRLLVTVLGAVLPPADLAVVAARIAAGGGNIDRIVRTASYPVTAVELTVSGAEHLPLRTGLAEVAADLGVDVAVQPAGLRGRGTHLLVMDVDSTLIQDEVIELIAAHAGRAAEVRSVTEAAMRGELDFTESLHARVALLAGLPELVLDQVREQVRLTPGARTLCRTLVRLGYRLAVVSGGFTQVVEPIAAELGIHHSRANVLEVVDGRLTGRVVGAVVDRAAKAAALREFAAQDGIPLSRTVAIGDGANDLDMLAAAGLGVAFNAKPVVRAQAHTGLTVPYLDPVLYLLGITRDEVEQADLEA
ncbi:MAG TPA: phosphoserine phosphatase SerB [Candidatus Nanopelagicales bacterium]|jgi:phosphoserine phosphatase|nr:phosphoserine phosphatase SerB [Candidatus Nanopelagicales bacterium]